MDRINAFTNRSQEWKERIIENLWLLKSLYNRGFNASELMDREGIDSITIGLVIDTLFGYNDGYITETYLPPGRTPRGYERAKEENEDDEGVLAVDNYLGRPRIEKKIRLPQIEEISEIVSNREREYLLQEIKQIIPEKPDSMEDEFYLPDDFFPEYEVLECISWFKEYIAGDGLKAEGIIITMVDLHPEHGEIFFDRPPLEMEYYKLFVDLYDNIINLVNKYCEYKNSA